jgi:hypothetical protein
MILFARGRRLFGVSCICLFLVAALHTIGNTLPPPPTGPQYQATERAMMSYRVPLGMGMGPSVWDIHRSLVFTMSVCLVAMGALGVVVGAANDATPRLISRTALVQAISSAVLTALFLFYQITPAFISMAVVTALFAGAVVSSNPEL